MAVSQVSFLGQADAANAKDALFLKLFGGEVLTTFETATVMKPLHTIRTISSGKSAQFPVTGVASAKYHTPGNDVAADGSMLSQIKHNERLIAIDDLLVASTFIDKLDEMKNHYDVRSIYSTELGRALAKTFDKNLISVACLTAATYGGTDNQVLTARAGVADNPNGSVITANFGATTTTYGDIPLGTSDATIKLFIDAMYTAAATLDKNNVPSEDRYTIVTPTTYYNVINSSPGRQVVNRDFGGGGSYQDAQIATIAGIRLVKSNIAGQVFGRNLGNSTTGATLSAGTAGVNNVYGANFLRVCGVVFHKSAFGTVKLMDLSMESGYDMRLQGHLMIAKYAMGSSWLRPEACVVLAHNAAVGTV